MSQRDGEGSEREWERERDRQTDREGEKERECECINEYMHSILKVSLLNLGASIAIIYT